MVTAKSVPEAGSGERSRCGGRKRILAQLKAPYQNRAVRMMAGVVELGWPFAAILMMVAFGGVMGYRYFAADRRSYREAKLYTVAQTVYIIIREKINNRYRDTAKWGHAKRSIVIPFVLDGVPSIVTVPYCVLECMQANNEQVWLTKGGKDHNITHRVGVPYFVSGETMGGTIRVERDEEQLHLPPQAVLNEEARSKEWTERSPT